MKTETRSLAIPTPGAPPATGDPTSLRDLQFPAGLFLSGNFSGTIQLQLSADGSSFVDWGAPLVYAGVSIAHIPLDAPALWIQAKVTAYAAGACVATIVGINCRGEG
jgi:hypothetical protein